MWKGPSASIALICNSDRRLQNQSRPSVHIELAPGKPTEVSWISGIEQKEWSLAVRRNEVDHQATGGLLHPELEPRLLDDIADKLLVEFEKEKPVISSVQNLHLFVF